MPKLLIYAVGTFISILVLLFLVAFLVDINKVSRAMDPLQPVEQQEEVNDTTKKVVWLNLLDKDKKDDFYYPVTEITIDLDLDQNVDNKFRNRVRNFKLVTQTLNEHHYFCLKQVLEQSRVKHKLERFDNEIAVILYSNSPKALETIVKELNIYDIKSNVQEIRK
jgi:hypothetical protein